MKGQYILMPEIDGQKITFVSIYKNEFNSWNFRDEVVLTPQEIDRIPLQRIIKFKIYNQQPLQGHYLIKIEQRTTDSPNDINTGQKVEVNVHLYAVGEESHRLFFEKLLIYKFLSMDLQFDPTQTFKTQIEDRIMKKSQILGNWEERHVRITVQQGLTSKKFEKQKESLHIKQTKEIWTRFELLNNRLYVVMKVKYLLGKCELAIPSRECGKWIRALYSIFTYV